MRGSAEGGLQIWPPGESDVLPSSSNSVVELSCLVLMTGMGTNGLKAPFFGMISFSAKGD